MATINKIVCDACKADIEVGDGEQPARVLVYAKTPASVHPAHDQHDLCDACWQKLCAAFPSFKEAERLVAPAPVPAPQPQLPPQADTWTPEQILVALASKLGVKVVKSDDE